MSETRYFGWKNHAEMVSSFADYGEKAPEGIATDAEVLLASYGGGGYDGDAVVLFVRDGVLYEVHASHCSCYGLEGQWNPEVTSWAALAMRPRPTSTYAEVMYDHAPEARAAFWRLVDSALPASTDASTASAPTTTEADGSGPSA